MELGGSYTRVTYTVSGDRTCNTKSVPMHGYDFLALCDQMKMCVYA